MNYCINVQTFEQIKFDFFTAFICPKSVIKVKVLIIPLFILWALSDFKLILLMILFIWMITG